MNRGGDAGDRSSFYLGVGQLPVLEARHVAAESELLAVEPLQVLLPGRDLSPDLAPALRLGHDGELQLRHVLQLLILHDIIIREERKTMQFSSGGRRVKWAVSKGTALTSRQDTGTILLGRLPKYFPSAYDMFISPSLFVALCKTK